MAGHDPNQGQGGQREGQLGAGGGSGEIPWEFDPQHQVMRGGEIISPQTEQRPERRYGYRQNNPPPPPQQPGHQHYTQAPPIQQPAVFQPIPPFQYYPAPQYQQGALYYPVPQYQAPQYQHAPQYQAAWPAVGYGQQGGSGAYYHPQGASGGHAQQGAIGGHYQPQGASGGPAVDYTGNTRIEQAFFNDEGPPELRFRRFDIDAEQFVKDGNRISSIPLLVLARHFMADRVQDTVRRLQELAQRVDPKSHRYTQIKFFIYNLSDPGYVGSPIYNRIRDRVRRIHSARSDFELIGQLLSTIQLQFTKLGQEPNLL